MPLSWRCTGEKRAVAFFRHVADTATDDKVLKMALELVEEEEEHVALLKEWQERFPNPMKAGMKTSIHPPCWSKNNELRDQALGDEIC